MAIDITMEDNVKVAKISGKGIYDHLEVKLCSWNAAGLACGNVGKFACKIEELRKLK